MTKDHEDVVIANECYDLLGCGDQFSQTKVRAPDCAKDLTPSNGKCASL